MDVFSATVLKNTSVNPLEKPNIIGHIYKNPVDPKSAKRLLAAVDEINNDLKKENK